MAALQHEGAHLTGPKPIHHVTWRDLQDLLARHGHLQNLEELDLKLLIDRFDRDNDGLIGAHEFFN